MESVVKATKFDRLAMTVAGKRTRRDVLKGIVGLAAAASVGAVVVDGAEAARRGFSGPPVPGKTPPAPCIPDCSEDICELSDGCGGTCVCQGTDTCVDFECRAECEILGLCAP